MSDIGFNLITNDIGLLVFCGTTFFLKLFDFNDVGAIYFYSFQLFLGGVPNLWMT